MTVLGINDMQEWHISCQNPSTTDQCLARVSRVEHLSANFNRVGINGRRRFEPTSRCLDGCLCYCGDRNLRVVASWLPLSATCFCANRSCDWLAAAHAPALQLSSCCGSRVQLL